MNIFITGTDTNVGKTIISAWICSHSNYEYFKPIQTGRMDNDDSSIIKTLCPKTKVHQEAYQLSLPLSPHLAAMAENITIDIFRIKCPDSNNLIIEGAGGLLVPINQKYLMIDLIQYFNHPVILVMSSKLGTINHSLLSIEALRARNIPILGAIMYGPFNSANAHSIEFYGKIDILDQVENFTNISNHDLLTKPLSKKITNLLGISL